MGPSLELPMMPKNILHQTLIAIQSMSPKMCGWIDCSYTVPLSILTSIMQTPPSLLMLLNYDFHHTSYHSINDNKRRIARWVDYSKLAIVQSLIQITNYRCLLLHLPIPVMPDLDHSLLLYKKWWVKWIRFGRNGSSRWRWMVTENVLYIN